MMSETTSLTGRELRAEGFVISCINTDYSVSCRKQGCMPLGDKDKDGFSEKAFLTVLTKKCFQ